MGVHSVVYVGDDINGYGMVYDCLYLSRYDYNLLKVKGDYDEIDVRGFIIDNEDWWDRDYHTKDENNPFREEIYDDWLRGQGDYTELMLFSRAEFLKIIPDATQALLEYEGDNLFIWFS